MQHLIQMLMQQWERADVRRVFTKNNLMLTSSAMLAMLLVGCNKDNEEKIVEAINESWDETIRFKGADGETINVKAELTTDGNKVGIVFKSIDSGAEYNLDLKASSIEGLPQGSSGEVYVVTVVSADNPNDSIDAGLVGYISTKENSLNKDDYTFIQGVPFVKHTDGSQYWVVSGNDEKDEFAMVLSASKDPEDATKLLVKIAEGELKSIASQTVSDGPFEIMIEGEKINVAYDAEGSLLLSSSDGNVVTDNYAIVEKLDVDITVDGDTYSGNVTVKFHIYADKAAADADTDRDEALNTVIMDVKPDDSSAQGYSVHLSDELSGNANNPDDTVPDILEITLAADTSLPAQKVELGLTEATLTLEVTKVPAADSKGKASFPLTLSVAPQAGENVVYSELTGDKYYNKVVAVLDAVDDAAMPLGLNLDFDGYTHGVIKAFALAATEGGDAFWMGAPAVQGTNAVVVSIDVTEKDALFFANVELHDNGTSESLWGDYAIITGAANGGPVPDFGGFFQANYDGWDWKVQFVHHTLDFSDPDSLTGGFNSNASPPEEGIDSDAPYFLDDHPVPAYSLQDPSSSDVVMNFMIAGLEDGVLQRIDNKYWHVPEPSSSIKHNDLGLGCDNPNFCFVSNGDIISIGFAHDSNNQREPDQPEPGQSGFIYPKTGDYQFSLVGDVNGDGSLDIHDMISKVQNNPVTDNTDPLPEQIDAAYAILNQPNLLPEMIAFAEGSVSDSASLAKAAHDDGICTENKAGVGVDNGTNKVAVSISENASINGLQFHITGVAQIVSAMPKIEGYNPTISSQYPYYEVLFWKFRDDQGQGTEDQAQGTDDQGQGTAVTAGETLMTLSLDNCYSIDDIQIA